ncbi:MAG TPA: hypothetical protein VK400_03960 [Pyrinomonadaceae bacterium]|nr:hypothetical protein [Pyrinomonadaceae bacterium]
MLKKSLFGLFIVLAFAAGARAQAVHTPAKNSAERAAILNALRVPVEKKLKQKISFSVSHFKIQGRWAFLSGEPQSARGGRPDYRSTPYREAVDSGAFDNNFFALLKKTGAKWTVVTYAIGCTDVCYLEWQTDYKAPKAVFPYAPE